MNKLLGVSLTLLFAANSWSAPSEAPFVTLEELKTRAAIKKSQDFLIRRENLNYVLVPPNILNQVSGLRVYASKPTESAARDFASYNFCNCELEAILKETPHRTTYFIKPQPPGLFLDAFVTIWDYRQSGASIDVKSGVSNIKVGPIPGSYGLATAPGSTVGLIKLNLYGVNKIVEIAMRISDLSSENLDEISALLSAGSLKIQLVMGE